MFRRGHVGTCFDPDQFEINLRPLKGGGMLQPLFDFFLTIFWATEGCKTAICNLYEHAYNASFHKSESKFGDVIWVVGVVKVVGRGEVDETS